MSPIHPRTRARSLAAALVLSVVGACATPRPPTLAGADYPGELRPPAALGPDLLWHQRVSASWAEGGQRSFEAAIQKRGDVLTVIGLSPLGSTGFVILLEGGEVEFQNHTGEELPFPPRFILLDVQRVFFPWTNAAPDGVHERVVGGERVLERWHAGRLLARTFTRLNGSPAGSIEIVYEWEHDHWVAPSHAILTNGWLGYRLSIDTYEETRLGAALDP